MTNEKDTFLKISKNKYFKNKDLEPIKILILSQIEEFERNNKECFMTDETFAENFNCSVSTINRAIKDLTIENYIIKNTKNQNVNGKIKTIRKLSINHNKLTCQNDNQEQTILVENTDVVSCQNDLLKDNNTIKDNISNANEEIIVLNYKPRKKIIDSLL